MSRIHNPLRSMAMAMCMPMCISTGLWGACGGGS